MDSADSELFLTQKLVYSSVITMTTHILSILQAVLVTFLWSTSFIIIKKGLPTIPPITFAGLRYFLASLCLLPFAFRRLHRSELRMLRKDQWLKLTLLGLVFYVLTQGAQFLGLLVMVSGVVSNAASSVLGRNVNRKKDLSPFVVTFVSMSVGSIVLLSLGLAVEGVPSLPLKSWLSLIWLSGVNTAFAFTLWNRTLRHLTAMESSIINGTMLIQIAILAWAFLGENLSAVNLAGMLLASTGAIFVQFRPRPKEGRDDR